MRSERGWLGALRGLSSDGFGCRGIRQSGAWVVTNGSIEGWSSGSMWKQACHKVITLVDVDASDKKRCAAPDDFIQLHESSCTPFMSFIFVLNLTGFCLGHIVRTCLPRSHRRTCRSVLSRGGISNTVICEMP
jgi:hypothetical protein